MSCTFVRASHSGDITERRRGRTECCGRCYVGGRGCCCVDRTPLLLLYPFFFFIIFFIIFFFFFFIIIIGDDGREHRYREESIG